MNLICQLIYKLKIRIECNVCYKMIDRAKEMFLLDFQFYMPVKVVSGFQSVMKNKALFKTYGKSALIVTGGSSAEKSGALKDVCTAFEKEGIDYSVFDRVGPNPLVSVCYAKVA